MTFDIDRPDLETADYDKASRAIGVPEPRIPDPIRQARGRASRNRGHKAEREWVSLIEAACNRSHVPLRDFPEKRGTSGTSDFTWADVVGEVKSRMHDWPTPAVRRHAWEQLGQRAGWRTPVVVECLRWQGRVTEWRVWVTPDAWVSGDKWISDRVIALLGGQA